MNNLYYVLGAGALAMVYAFWKTSWINSQVEGSDRMKQIGASIADGAMAFLKAEYRVLSVFVIIVGILFSVVIYYLNVCFQKKNFVNILFLKLIL